MSFFHKSLYIIACDEFSRPSPTQERIKPAKAMNAAVKVLRMRLLKLLVIVSGNVLLCIKVLYHVFLVCSAKEPLFVKVFWQGANHGHITLPIRQLVDNTVRLAEKPSSSESEVSLATKSKERGGGGGGGGESLICFTCDAAARLHHGYH